MAVSLVVIKIYVLQAYAIKRYAGRHTPKSRKNLDNKDFNGGSS
jgi:hypothetical protein